ncbi:hypothetical protein ACNKHU_14540 [Shigella flexneri]
MLYINSDSARTSRSNLKPTSRCWRRATSRLSSTMDIGGDKAFLI